MRVNSKIEDSPIAELLEDAMRSVVLIAPERAREVEPLVADLTIDVTDSQRSTCFIEPVNKRIELSRRFLEHLWCSAYAYWLLYATYVAGQEFVVPSSVDLTQDPQVKAAMQLLSWSYRALKAEEKMSWPDGLPRPERQPVPESDIHVANELMLCTVAFFLHHELAHLRFKHIPGIESIEQEREADYGAVEWLLAKCPRPLFFKRALAAATGLSILAAKEIQRGTSGSSSHPPGYERLVNSLSRQIDDPNDPAWGFAIVILKLHLDQVRAPIDEKKVYDTFRDVADAYAEVLSKRMED